MGINYRLAEASDLPSVSKVFGTAIDDISSKHGFLDEPTPTSPPNPQYAFWLKKEPKAFWVAEDQGQVVGYTFSFVRGTLWFLADLFILPGYQGKGIGGELIMKTLGSWRGTKIANRALITPAFNRSSVSLYMRYEMFPRQPVYAASAKRVDVVEAMRGMKSRMDVEETGDVESSLATLDRINRRALGFPTGWHPEFFLKVLKARCLIFRRDGRAIGYSFVRSDGRIGPVVASSTRWFPSIFESCLQAATEAGGESVTMCFPGTNVSAVKIGIRCGFRIEYPLLFLSSKSMGEFGNYLFYSPGLM